MRHDYAFVSRWHVVASPDRCWAVLEESLRTGVVHWWPAVRFEQVTADAGTALAPGDTIRLVVRSPIGYRLRITLALTEVIAGRAIAATSAGDLAGRGRLDLVSAGTGSELTWSWQVEVRKRWMRAVGPVVRPAFEAAHRAVMSRGERGLAVHLNDPA